VDSVHDLAVEKKSPAKIPRHFAKKPLCFFEINLRSSFADFALRPLYFFEFNPQSMILQLGPELKNIYKKVPSLRKIHKNSSKTSKIHIFPTTTPNLVILVPKFSESITLSFCAFI
jgi:hypothetical protein